MKANCITSLKQPRLLYHLKPHFPHFQKLPKPYMVPCRVQVSLQLSAVNNTLHKKFTPTICPDISVFSAVVPPPNISFKHYFFWLLNEKKKHFEYNNFTECQNVYTKWTRFPNKYQLDNLGCRFCVIFKGISLN